MSPGTRRPRFRSRCHLAVALFGLVSLLGACEKETQSVIVSLHPQGLDAAARWLLVRTTLGSQRTLVRNRYRPPLEEVDLKLPADSVGTASFEVEVLDAFGAPLSRGTGGISVNGIGRYSLDLPLTPLSPATVVLRDGFDDGDFAKNPGDGGRGFTLIDLPYAGRSDRLAIEQDGMVVVSGDSTLKQLNANQAFDPTGTTLTVVVARRSGGFAVDGGVNELQFGWASEGELLCCQPSINVSVRDFDLTFNIQPQGNFQDPNRHLDVRLGSSQENAVFLSSARTDFILSIYVDLTRWRVDLQAPGLELHQQGQYGPGNGLAEVLAATGGRLQPSIAFGRQQASGTVDSLLVTRP